jgi:polyhydroxyalkanoate synthesis regulator phasin
MADGYKLGDGLKKLVLAGIGAVAETTEKSSELIDNLAKKGEITVEQGKELNKELKHNLRQTIDRNQKKPDGSDDIGVKLAGMTMDELDALKTKILQTQEKLKNETKTDFTPDNEELKNHENRTAGQEETGEE